MAQTVKNLPAKQETRFQSLGCEDPLEKGMATHSSFFAWRKRSLAGYNSCSCTDLDMTVHAHIHTLLILEKYKTTMKYHSQIRMAII